MTQNTLKLDHQLCFPMYQAAKAIMTTYGELLAPLDLTYTQYLVMMVLWEHETIDMKALGDRLSLDSSTLTPLLNRLIKKGYLSKKRDAKDRRSLIITLEPEGKGIMENARALPAQIYAKVDLTASEVEHFRSVLDKIVVNLSEK